jgi:hypothetical protein
MVIKELNEQDLLWGNTVTECMLGGCIMTDQLHDLQKVT